MAALVRSILSTAPKQISTTTTNNFRRHITTTRHLTNKEYEIPKTEPKKVEIQWMPNGSMKRGPKYFQDYWMNEKGAFGWFLMPGVPKKNVKVNVVGTHVCFEGFEDEFVPGFPPPEMLRFYKAEFFVEPHLGDVSKVKAEIVNGIFWIHVPKN